jgi:hypothetical protein
MERGPWIFRNMAVLLHPYDGLSKAEEVEFFHIPIWLQIHKLPDGYCKKEIVEKLIKNAGEVLEVRLQGNSRGDYIRVRVKHDVREPLTKFVSIVRGKERQVFAVRYEKLARFCKFCGKIGHEYKECGNGIYAAKDLKYGDWLYADPPNFPRDLRGGAGGSTYRETPKGGHGANSKKDVISDTAPSPVKNLGASVVHNDRNPKKRLNMDGNMINDVSGKQPVSLPLLLTDKEHEEEDSDSPINSQDSKRAKIDGHSGNNSSTSADPLDGDRRDQ